MLRRDGTPLRFVLVPMMHVAAPSFYRQVRRRLAGCDLIVADGVRGKAGQLSGVTLACQFAQRRRRDGVEEQDAALLVPDGIAVIRPDVTAAAALAALKILLRWMYWLLLGSAPVMEVIVAVRGPRAVLVPRPGAR